MNKLLRHRYVSGAGVIALFLALLTLYGSQRKITNFPSSNIGVAAFGDSLVEGTGSTLGGGWVRIASNDLNIQIANLGKKGDTTSIALKRVDEVARRKPAVTIVLLGGNDFLQGVPEIETIDNLSRIIEAIQKSGSAVVLVGLKAPTINSHSQKIFENISQKYKTAYVGDALRGIYGNGALMSSDGIHPNDIGYGILAQRIEIALRSLLP